MLLIKRKPRKGFLHSPPPHTLLSLPPPLNPSLSSPLSSAAIRPLGMSGLPLKSPGTGRQARILGDGSVFPWWQVCPLRAGQPCLSGSVCMGHGVLTLLRCWWLRGVRSMKWCLLASCLSVSGCRDKRSAGVWCFFKKESGLLHFLGILHFLHSINTSFIKNYVLCYTLLLMAPQTPLYLLCALCLIQWETELPIIHH